MTDVVNRSVYGRMYAGTLATQVDAGMASLRGQIFDRMQMPALLVESGKAIAVSLTLDTAGGALPLPPDYDDDNRLYFALTVTAPVLVVVVSPTHGTSTIRIGASSGTTDGEHVGFYVSQCDITSITITPNSTQVEVNAFMYEIPDITDQGSYVSGSLYFGTGDVV